MRNIYFADVNMINIKCKSHYYSKCERHMYLMIQLETSDRRAQTLSFRRTDLSEIICQFLRIGRAILDPPSVRCRCPINYCREIWIPPVKILILATTGLALSISLLFGSLSRVLHPTSSSILPQGQISHVR